MALLEHVYSFGRVGGDGANGIEGGGGDVIVLPGRDVAGNEVDATGYRAQRGDLAVLSLCAAGINVNPGATDASGTALPVDGRSWATFMEYDSESLIPYASAQAVILGDDLSAIGIQYGGGILGFLDEGYTLDLYQGVESLDLVDFTGITHADQTTLGTLDLTHHDVRATAILAAIGQRNFSGVPGFIGPDDTGGWASESLTWPGFNTTRLVSWQTTDLEPRGRRWAEYAIPDGETVWLPNGLFVGQGSIPVLLPGLVYLTLKPDQQVTRQFPRDDGYGLIGGGRIYPPTRQGRVYGGQT